MRASVDPAALFDGRALGNGSRIHAYARVAESVAIGSDCVVHEHAVLDGVITLEDGVEVGVGALVLGHVKICDAVKIGPGAVLGSPWAATPDGDLVVRPRVTVGANATLAAGIDVGRGAVVEPGAVVGENVPANAVVGGNPARIVTYVEAGPTEAAPSVDAGDGAERTVHVRGVTLHALTRARDLRGSLTAVEFSKLPFQPLRAFTVYDVPSESVRGAHAHRVCAQFLVCLRGEVTCLVDDGSARDEIPLASADVGLLIEPMVWGTQWKYSRDAILLVLASHPYDPDDYIRDYEEFLQAVSSPRSQFPNGFT